MANAVVGDFGDLLKLDVGVDLSDKENLRLFITMPDGTVVSKTSADGVTFGTPTNTHLNYTTESGLCGTQDGTYKLGCYFEQGSVGIYSQPTPSEYVVRRRNQTP